MKIANFTDSQGTRIGLVKGDGIIDLSLLAPTLPGDIKALLLVRWVQAETGL